MYQIYTGHVQVSIYRYTIMRLTVQMPIEATAYPFGEKDVCPCSMKNNGKSVLPKAEV